MQSGGTTYFVTTAKPTHRFNYSVKRREKCALARETHGIEGPKVGGGGGCSKKKFHNFIFVFFWSLILSNVFVDFYKLNFGV